MTYEWNIVEAEARRLYVAGWTLEDIRHKFRNERDFKAGTRVWRTMLKKWQAKKTSRRTHRTRTGNLLTCEHHKTNGVILVESDAGAQGVAEPGTQRRHGFPLEVNRLRPVSKQGDLWVSTDVDAPDCMRTSAGRLLETLSSSSPQNPNESHRVDITPVLPAPWSERCYERSRAVRIQELYNSLTGVTSFEAASSLLQGVPFQDREDSILHLAAKHQESATLRTVVQFMRLGGLSLQIRDKQGHTALHLALLAGSTDNLVVLLGADRGLLPSLLWALQNGISDAALKTLVDFGAQVDKRGPGGRIACELAIAKDRPIFLNNTLAASEHLMSPEGRNTWMSLAVQARASLDTCDIILVYWNKWFRPYHVAMAVEVILEKLVRCEDEDEELYLYSVLRRSLDKPGLLQPDLPDHVDLYQAFLGHASLIKPATRLEVLGCLHMFFLAGFDPLQPYDTDVVRCNHERRCQSPAAAILYHSSDVSTIKLMLESFSVGRYGPGVFSSVLAAYGGNQHLFKDADLLEPFEIILKRYQEYRGKTDLLRVVLKDGPRQLGGRTVKLVDLLRQYGCCEGFRYNPQSRASVLHLLTLVPEPLRWRLAHIILQPWTNTHGFHRACQLFPYDINTEYMEYVEICHHELSHLTSNTFILYQCIVHVVTQCMLTNTGYDSMESRLREVHVLRCRVGLPNLLLDLEDTIEPIT